RSSDIGNEREKSRIGTCRAAGAFAVAGSAGLFAISPFQAAKRLRCSKPNFRLTHSLNMLSNIQHHD
uniref:hypothetical protein n=1 Tax=Streptomyces europaeiscabiei TaxID=146819 RepID=UPI0038F79836